MAPKLPLSASDFLRSQVCVKMPVPTKSFAGKTVIVTGSNAGLGREAVRHLVRLGASKVILAVRSLERGSSAAADIRRTTSCGADVMEVWQLDLADYGSVIRFAAKVDAELPRLDVVVENAGMLTEKFTRAGDDETHIRVNVLGTMLLGLLLLPKLRRTAEAFSTDVVLTFVGSWMHWVTDFPEQNAPNIFDALNVEEKARMKGFERYATSKLMELLLFRELVANLTQPKAGHVVTSIINPGAVKTDINRDDNPLLMAAAIKVSDLLVLRTTEVGGRILVHAAEGSRDTDGQYLCDCKPARPELLSPFVKSEQGAKVQKKLWREMMAKFETIKPGVTQNV